jgi:pimeloyl-ACP methyl ester carboxylesterase
MAPPLWRESRLGLETAALLRSPIFRGHDVDDGRGQPVLLIPGFLAGDDSLGLMTGWLRRTGHHTAKAGMRANIGCSGTVIDRLEARLETLTQRQGQKAAIVGQSRGGSFAKAIAQRRPDLVSGIVTLGAPLRRQLAVHPLVGLQVVAVGALGTFGAPGLMRRSCLSGECCAEFRDALGGRLDPKVGFVCVYSKSDGICQWEACIAPEAEAVEVRSSHIGMAVHRHVYRAVADALTDYREPQPSRGTVTPLRRAA